MGAPIVALIAVVALVAIFAVSRRARERRHAGSRTVVLRMTADCVERVLADGRAETARWDRLVRVEVICTPVATADGARLFAMLAESGPNDESPIGCLVPLGVGHDERLLDRLVRLPGFSVAVWQSSQGHRPPKRTVVWQRHPSASGDPSGDWDG